LKNKTNYNVFWAKKGKRPDGTVTFSGRRTHYSIGRRAAIL